MIVNMESSKGLLKTGGCSIIMGKDHYAGHFPEKPNKLLKITNIFKNHNELRYESIIRSIENNKDYYAIPESEIIELKTTSAFYKLLKNMYEKEVNIFYTNLSCLYVDYAGSMDVFDSILKMSNERDKSIWKSPESILRFANHVMKGLSFLHIKKICHLDIKPENIMLDFKGRNKIQFRIIDFGFSSIEPFTDFIGTIRGTPGYFPAKLMNNKIEPGLPEVYANDMLPDANTGVIPMKTNYKFVYKVDSYCLGRLLNYLYYNYTETFNTECCPNFTVKKRSTLQLEKLILDLAKNSVYLRPYIVDLAKEL